MSIGRKCGNNISDWLWLIDWIILKGKTEHWLSLISVYREEIRWSARNPDPSWVCPDTSRHCWGGAGPIWGETI